MQTSSLLVNLVNPVFWEICPANQIEKYLKKICLQLHYVISEVF